MKNDCIRTMPFLGALAAVPFLLAANGNGCQSADGTTSDGGTAGSGTTGSDAGSDETAGPARDGACVDNILCIQGSVWDPVQCRCVPEATDGAANDGAATDGGATDGRSADEGSTDGNASAPDAVCIDNVLCIQGDVWDSVLCRCVPKATDGGGCQSAQDCNGVLPQICMVCPSGATACAHWTCVSGQCQTVICE